MIALHRTANRPARNSSSMMMPERMRPACAPAGKRRGSTGMPTRRDAVRRRGRNVRKLVADTELFLFGQREIHVDAVGVIFP